MSILLTSLTMFLTSRIQHYQPGGKRWLTMGSNEVWLGAAILVGTHSRQCRDDLLKRSGDCFQWSPSSRATCDLASGLQTARRGALVRPCTVSENSCSLPIYIAEDWRSLLHTFRAHTVFCRIWQRGTGVSGKRTWA